MIVQSALLASLKAYHTNVAIEESGRKVTYVELLSNSDKVTRYLLEKDLLPGSTIGINLDSTSDIVSAIIGILNARCTFVLVDERLPQLRLSGMIEELSLSCLLVSRLNDQGPLSTIEQCLFGNIQAEEVGAIAYPEFEEDDSVYIYFTSGSTGKPKGIIGRNSSLIQFLNWEIASFKITEKMRFSQFISPYFDAFLRDIFVPVLSGATICVPPKEEDFFTFGKLKPWLEDNRINIIHCVPSVFRVLNNSLLTSRDLTELRYVLMSGEKIIPSDLKTWYETFGDSIQLVNLYGTTETTMIRCMYEIQPSDANKSRMPIGDPIDGTEILIADRDLNPCSPLVTGDLYIVTEYATKGYLNDEKLTQEKFIKTGEGVPNRIAFRTGDKARRLADGTIDLLGREDRQVKLRGIRVELEEIEIVLARPAEVRNAVVVLDSTGESLTAYIILNEKVRDNTLWEETIATYAGQQLPAYMVPSKYFEVTEYPLLANGKIDYGALADYKKKKRVTGYSNEMEAKILSIWKTILGDKEISVDESFHSAGGTSLSIMRLITKIFSEFNVRVSLSELFNNLTVQKQAVLVKDKIVELHLSQIASVPAGLAAKDQNPIRKADKKEFYKASSAQKGLYFLHNLNPGSTSYNFPSVMILSGEVEKEKVNNTLFKLIERHQGLRTSFELVDGEPVQRLNEKFDFCLDYLEISENQVESTIVDFVKPFDLSKTPLIRAGLAKISNEKSLLVVDMPHIISDHMTRGILARDFKSIYNNESLPDLNIDYIDYAEWQQNEENKGAQLEDRNFWMQQFADKPPVLELPLDFPRPPEFSFAGDTIFFEVGGDLINKLDIIAEREGVNKFVVFLSAYYVLLHRLSSQEDIVVGISTLGRKFQVLDQVVGVFINTLAVRSQPNEKKSFKDFLQEVKQSVHTALDHQDFPFSELISSLNLERDQSRNSLFDVMFEYYTDADEDNQISVLNVTPYKENNTRKSKFDLSLHIHEANNKALCSFTYATDLFYPATITRFISYFRELLNSVAQDIEMNIFKLKILPENEHALLTKTFNDTTRPYPGNSTIVSLFEDQVLKSLDQPAVFFKNKSLTYGELNERANRVAKYLSLHGVCNGSVVGLMVDRSIEMVVGILGILKAGGGYLPIDPTLPEKRIGYMMNQSNMMLLLTQEQHIDRYAAYLPVKDINTIDQNEHSSNLNVAINPKDLAYCIFTSGSTGSPKGVMMKHKSVVNLVKGLEEKIYDHYGNQSLRVALLASYAFDASVQQIFGALLLGHCLYIAEEDDRKNGDRLIAFYNQCKIDISDGTPTHLRILTDAFKPGSQLECMSTWIIAGEILPVKVARDFFIKTNDKVRLFNLYGPTETCVDSTYYHVRREHLDSYATIPIGKPLPNERIYITDSYGNLVPIGIVGELCIAGDGLADRYIGDESMTSQKFDSDWILGEQSVYHTGDLARWLPDGNIEYKGRADNQIKLRGYRIELGEIEHQLNSHENIKSSVVQVHEKESEFYLVAYYTSDIKLSVKELKDYLGEKLPDYMIPSFFVYMTEFPLTINGKVDTKLLPGHELEEEDCYDIPSGEVEESLAGIWSEILKIEKNKISRKSSFFDLGGHSLRAVYLASKIYREFDVEVTLKDVFKYQVLSKMADMIQNSKKFKYTSIPHAEIKEYYPLTSSQRRLYFLYEFDKDSIAYNLPHIIRLKGELDIRKLEISFNKLVARHESLRTSFDVIGDEVVQKIHDDVKLSISFVESDPSLVSLCIREFIRPFDLSKAPLIRVCVIKTAPGDHVLVVDIHHIVTDGVSQGILIKDFSAFYNNEKLPKSFLQYKDYAEWQNKPDQQKRLKGQQEFWINEFQSDVSKLELPADFERPVVKNFSGSSIQFSLSHEMTRSLKKLGEEMEATPFMTMLSIFYVFLSKLSNQQDIVIGVSTAGRGDHPDLQHTVGMFVNTLPLRSNFNPEWGFLQFLKEVKNKTLSCFENQSYQYEELIGALNIPRDTNRNPLFDVLFFFQNFDEEQLDMRGLTLEHYKYQQNVTKFDLALSAIEEENQLRFKLDYSTELFKETTIRRFVTYFQQIISSVIENPSCTLSGINVLPDNERQQQLIEFNQTGVAFAADKTIIDLFKEQVKSNPDNCAVVVNNQKLSYKELDGLSDTLAAEIQVLQKDSRQPIAIYTDPSVEMIIAMMAILKSGNSFLPLDPKQESGRYVGILRDSGSILLITQPDLSDKVVFDGQLLVIDLEQLRGKPAHGVKSAVNPRDLAYVIYTSGSTGTPKGVKICHENLVNYVCWFKNFAQLSSADKSVLISSYAFDLGYTAIFPTLLCGGELHLVDKDLYRSPEELLDYIKTTKITYLKLTPSLFTTFTIAENFKANTLNSLRYIVLGGESIKPDDIEIVHKYYGDIHFINHYGPTETTIGCVARHISFESFDAFKKRPAIGRPIANTKCYILDSANNLLPLGSKGELSIGGRGVGQGYLNDVDLSKSKFIDNPFENGDKLYKTGDLARWSANGEIEFLGRADDQVKINGYRLSAKEIENYLLTHVSVSEAVVLTSKDNDGVMRLVAYCVCSPAINAEMLRTYLSAKMPDYMVPSFFVLLDKMPLTDNGKLDKRALLDLEYDTQKEYAPASNPVEERLVQIWSEVLKLDASSISVNTGFFELGGNSLKAIFILNNIRKEFEVEIKVLELFQRQTIHSIAELIQNATLSTFYTIPKVHEKDYYATTSSQQRLYFLQEFDKNSMAYNMAQVVELKGALEKDRLEKAFYALISRHESLRTSFLMIDQRIVQKVSDKVEFKIEWFDSAESEVQTLISQFVRPFDLHKGPLMRVGLIRMSDELHLLMVDFHHIITDGISQRILIADFMALYNNEQLPEIKLRYRDYAEWLQSKEQADKIARQQEFWKQEFSEEMNVLKLPTDFTRPFVKRYSGNTITYIIGKEETSKLKSLAEEEGATMFMMVLSLFYVLLSKLSNQEDITVGTPVAGRQNADVQDIAGLFMNVIVLRNYPKGNLSYKEFFLTIKEKVLRCLDNQSFQYEELIKELRVIPDSSRNPLFDVVFAFKGLEEEVLKIPGLTLKPYKSGLNLAKFDLTLTAAELNGQLYVDVEYSTDLFRKETIERFIGYFQQVVKEVIEDVDKKLSQINILPEAERRQLQYTFNDTSADYPVEKTIIDLFEEQVEKTPENVAIWCGGKSMTYRQLKEKSDKIAAYLQQEKGVKCGDLVGLLLEREEEMLPSIFGILKSGAAYVPLSTYHPSARISSIISNAGLKALITRGRYIDASTIEIGAGLIDLDTFAEKMDEMTCMQPVSRPKGTDLAYVIYTSGSTGTPKGVMIAHHSVVNLLLWMQEEYSLTEEDVLLQKTPLIFDISICELFWWSFTGASVCVLPPEEEKNPGKIIEAIERYKVTIIQFVPSMLDTFLDEAKRSQLKTLRWVLSAGEALGVHHINKFREALHNKYGTQLANIYGPTEATVYTSYYNCDFTREYSNTIPIGKPVNNTKLYVLDKYGNIVPTGVPGELYIGGAGLARGYINDNDLTSKKFISHLPEIEGPVYCTGDLAQWDGDGNIEFLGRIDHQVKIRGFRIELGEIESQLITHPQIKEAVVITKEEDGNKCIIGYYVSDEEITVRELREHLSYRLPEYMLPSYYVHLKELPLTQSEKIDRNALPQPEFKVDNNYLAPSSEIEKKLAEIWSKVLQIDQQIIGLNSSFFELGGHSLQAIQMVNSIKNDFQVEIKLAEMFHKPTIIQQAELIGLEMWVLTGGEASKNTKKKVINI